MIEYDHIILLLTYRLGTFTLPPTQQLKLIVFPAIPSEKISYIENLIAEYDVHRNIITTPGGEERQDSVMEGLKLVEDDIILIHDGVRPFVNQKLVERVIEATKRYGAAVPVIPVHDTIKRVEKNKVIATLDRNMIYAIQTPQGFEKEIIKEAYETAYRDNVYGTDDAYLVERIGMGITTIEGDPLNIKLTRKEDFIFAETIVKRLRKSHAYW